MKASAFRRWPVAGAYSPEQTTRLTGGSDFHLAKTRLIPPAGTSFSLGIYPDSPKAPYRP